uniref:Uncharacterized protein n=1 Tax=Aureoumbra lagunensis TaxID=44058 RepID=A0A7S3K1V9_9STRA|mmetsp:Transcript_11169/g.15363  ORF Transcript_11169/g.15363 Transcript_11169/m.15363 type:complete len:504 (-) Transcript_11169:190-1701(-)
MSKRIVLALIVAPCLKSIVFAAVNKLQEHMQQYESNLARLQEGESLSIRKMVEPSGRRNHGCAVINDRHINILGRWAESTEEMSVGTEEMRFRPCSATKDDPDLCNLNHVVAVPIQIASNRTEIWLPCGFTGHRVGSEHSARYARIVHTDTLKVSRGPKLHIAGGACAALALPIHKKRLPAICTFGGTDGSHDYGTFLRTVSCYDLNSKLWFKPFANLPQGLDHANAILIDAGACHPNDPPRILLLNFRFQHFANMRTEIFIADLPSHGFTSSRTNKKKIKAIKWSLFSNNTQSLPRDASGAIAIKHGRYIVQYGGVFYAYDTAKKYAQKTKLIADEIMSAVGGLISSPIHSRNRGWHIRMDFAEIRALDICNSRDWFHVGRLRTSRFATQTCRSDDYVFTCGGRKGGQKGAKYGSGRDKQNLRDCEIQPTHHLELMVQNAATRTERRRERRPTQVQDPNVATLLHQRLSEEGRRALSTSKYHRVEELSESLLLNNYFASSSL